MEARRALGSGRRTLIAACRISASGDFAARASVAITRGSLGQ